MKDIELRGRVVIYTIQGCSSCYRAKRTLARFGLPFVEVDLNLHAELMNDLLTWTSRNSVPLIFFNDLFIGGVRDLEKQVKDEWKFQELIAYVRDNLPGPNAPQLPSSTVEKRAGLEDFVCEPDQYAALVADLRSSGIISDHRKGLSMYKHSFTGKNFIDWVVKTREVDRVTAIEMGESLIQQHFAHNVKRASKFTDDASVFRLLDDEQSGALNAGTMSECLPLPASALGESLRHQVLSIYGSHLSAEGKAVDYNGIAESEEFASYVNLTRELQRVDVSSLSREEKLAFFINVYNALVIHANITVGPPHNLWQRYRFFSTISYIIGGASYSLQDIENGILRANRKGVGQLFRPFGKSDPRLKVALQSPEPLIHFALVCGAKSCPPIKTYSAKNINEELQISAKSFLESDDGCTLDVSGHELALSQIFKWYREDFGSTNEEVAQWVYSHMEENEKKVKLGDMLKDKNVKVTFMPYDWSMNSQ
ncbi:PREDICTED: uncharacterized protein LOC106809184 [Priapulus caudatus]|uniref:Uncharacterized protein LOC106809184 n=1 Tax=Priapulus caudatus TaxID=37621 RepID=A0ABM1E641_PRICU|nr:PREDICTED: uncharacterized protein LOC106809184 [Priapulus caudatus]